MPRYDYDLVVIGAGSGGVRASRVAASLGAKVAVVEERWLGGTCVNAGCVPKKLLVYASEFAGAFAEAEGFGWDRARPGHDWRRLIAAKDAEITRLNGVYDRLLRNAGVTILDGRGVLAGPHTVEVDGRPVTADAILVATGGRPFVPDLPGADLGITSDDAFFLDAMPRRVIVVGGGYIAVEFAGIFAGLGAAVSLHYRGPLFLRGFDDDCRRFLAEQLPAAGVELAFDATVAAVESADDGLRARFSDGTTADADAVFFATGRLPNTAGLGLEAVGVETDARGAVVVDDQLRTSVPSVFALGDVIDRVALTPVALAEGMAFARSRFGGAGPIALDYEAIPSAVFSQPPLATVGLTESAAREAGHGVRIFRSTFTPMKHTLGGLPRRTMMKLVVDASTDRVLGCHVCGDDAAEIVQGFAVALRCGATKAQLDATIGIHPTAAEELVTLRTPVVE